MVMMDKVINMGEIHKLTLDIINTLVAKFSPKGLTFTQKVGLKNIKKEILKTPESELLEALIDVDKKIRREIYAEEVE